MKLLLIERAVLECLGNEEKNTKQISEETGIKVDVVERIIASFLDSEIIFRRESSYLVNNLKLAKLVKNKVKYEVEEMLDCFCDVHFSTKSSESNMKLRKIVLNQDEQRYFKSMWQNMEDYLNRVEQENHNKKVKDQTIVFWGWSEYSDMINQYMSI